MCAINDPTRSKSPPICAMTSLMTHNHIYSHSRTHMRMRGFSDTTNHIYTLRFPWPVWSWSSTIRSLWIRLCIYECIRGRYYCECAEFGSDCLLRCLVFTCVRFMSFDTSLTLSMCTYIVLPAWSCSQTMTMQIFWETTSRRNTLRWTTHTAQHSTFMNEQSIEIEKVFFLLSHAN